MDTFMKFTLEDVETGECRWFARTHARAYEEERDFRFIDAHNYEVHGELYTRGPDGKRNSSKAEHVFVKRSWVPDMKVRNTDPTFSRLD